MSLGVFFLKTNMPRKYFALGCNLVNSHKLSGVKFWSVLEWETNKKNPKVQGTKREFLQGFQQMTLLSLAAENT